MLVHFISFTVVMCCKLISFEYIIQYKDVPIKDLKQKNMKNVIIFATNNTLDFKVK